MLEVKNLVIVLVFSFVVFKILRKKFDLLDTFVVLLPFKSIIFDVGLSIYAYNFPIIILGILSWFSKKKSNSFFNKEFYFIIFIAYVVISTILISNFFIDNYIKNEYFDTFFRGEGRYISNLFKTIFLDFGIVYLTFANIKNDMKIYHLINLYLKTLVVLSLLGILQVILSIVIGTDIFPNILDQNGNPVFDYVTDVETPLPFVRLTSLGGEPKGFASSLSIGIMLLVFLNREKITVIKHQGYIILLFLLCIIMTLSTSGFGLLFMLLIILIVTGLNKKSFWRFKKSYLLLIPFLIFFTARFWSLLQAIFTARVVDRSGELANEEVDEIIIKFLVKNPLWSIFGSGSGNIHNLVSPYVSEAGKGYSDVLQNNIFMSRYGYIKLISENGFVGFFLFIIAFGNILFRLGSIKNKDQTARFFYYSLTVMLVFYFARSNYVFVELCFITGLSISYIYLTKKASILSK